MNFVYASEFDFKTEKSNKRAIGKLSSIKGKIFYLPTSHKEAFVMMSDVTLKYSIWVKDIKLMNNLGTIYKPLWSSMSKNPGLSGWELLLK